MKFNWADCKVIAVVGNTGSGKTAACFNILSSIQTKDKYIVDHPLPEALEETGIKNIPAIAFEEMSDCVIWIDEPQLIYPKYQKRNNDGLMMMCSLARQRDVTLILSTSDTRWINKGMESYVDTWVIKNLDFNLVKNGSIIKNIINKKYNSIMPSSFRLNKEEAIVYCPEQLNKPEKVKVLLPFYWSDKLSKPYKYSSEKLVSIFNNIEPNDNSN